MRESEISTRIFDALEDFCSTDEAGARLASLTLSELEMLKDTVMDVIYEDTRKWRHVKRQTTYTEVGRGLLQTSVVPLVDGSRIVSYVGQDGKLWHREETEFEDGRMEEILSEVQPYEFREEEDG